MTIRRVFAAALVVATSALPAALLSAETPAALAKGKGQANKRVAVGHTAQGRTVRVRVGSQSLKVLHFSAKLKCRDGSVLVDKESGFQLTPLKHGGHFDDRQFGSTDTVRFRGHVAGNWVRGRARVSDRWGKVRCDSKWFKFSAKAKN